MKPNITMFFPAYNEEDSIEELVRNAKAVLKDVANKYEVLVVVYEGSTDSTKTIVKRIMSKDKTVKLVIQPRDKKGIGYAIKIGFDNAKYPYIFYSDSDNQFNLSEFKKFLPYIHFYDIIAGYRINRQDPLTRIITSKIYNIMMSVLFGVKERDVDCAFRLVNKRVFKSVKLICKLGLGTTELLVKARKDGFRIKQVGVHHFPRKKGSSVFESKGIRLPKPKVVFDLLREMAALREDLRNY